MKARRTAAATRVARQADGRAASRTPATAASVTAGAARPRRGRPPVISDERLLDVARDVFLARGIRATTAEVAERAQISEGTIFHRFRSKDALFRAAMRFEPADMPRLIESLTPRVGAADLRQTLVELASRLLALGRVALPMMMMSWSNPSGEYSLEKLLNKQVCVDGPLRALRDFFEGEMESGRLNRSDPELLARVFLGTCRDYSFLELLTGDPPRTPPDQFAEGLVDLVLRAAAPSKPARP